MADQSGANAVCSDASIGGSTDVCGRRPGSVLDVVVVGGRDVLVVVDAASAGGAFALVPALSCQVITPAMMIKRTARGRRRRRCLRRRRSNRHWGTVGMRSAWDGTRWGSPFDPVFVISEIVRTGGVEFKPLHQHSGAAHSGRRGDAARCPSRRRGSCAHLGRGDDPHGHVQIGARPGEAGPLVL
jgi:hypothetical protein